MLIGTEEKQRQRKKHNPRFIRRGKILELSAVSGLEEGPAELLSPMGVIKLFSVARWSPLL